MRAGAMEARQAGVGNAAAGALAGTGALMRLIVRRDRVVLAIWIVLPALLAVGVAAAFEELYPTAADLQAFAGTVAASPGELALLGPVYAPTLGGLVAWRWAMIGMVVAGLASLLTVIRHTRSEEAAGRRELLGATVAGRQAPLAAALGVTLGGNVLLAALVAAGLSARGLPPAGSVALGLSVAAMGATMAAVAAVAAQLTQSPGAARGLAGCGLALFFLLRAVGDAGGPGWLSWLSPAGWMRLVRPYAGERWWVLGLFAAAGGLLVAAAFALSARRDLDAGVLPVRPGPAEASPAMGSAWALAWRLQRGTLLGWTAAYAVLGVATGFLAQTVSEQLMANPQLVDYFRRLSGGATPGEAFLTLALLLIGEVATAYALQATLRLRAEETGNRADPVLATATGRLRWAAGHLAVAALGSVVVLLALGLVAGLAYGLSAGNVGHVLPRVIVAALAYVPALWVLAGLAAALFGLLPRLAVPLSWGALAAVLLLELGGELQQVSQGVLDLSPFAHVPRLLVGQGASAAPGWLAAAAAVLVGAGLVGLRRRDVG
jgi:ABC-2 type transport system permease protein